MPRIIVFAGAGGVGKTSVAAATATRCAARGLRTVVISTDIAHARAGTTLGQATTPLDGGVVAARGGG